MTHEVPGVKEILKMGLLVIRDWGICLHTIFLIITLVLTTSQPLLGNPDPVLIFESPESLRPLVKKLQKIDPQTILEIMDFVGLTHPGTPIRVILAPETSTLAEQAPAWASGYALSPASTVVLLTDRVTHYPDDSLEDVFFHEIGHVLIHRAAGENPLPRWFDEGLSMIVARRWDFEDRARLVWAMVTDTKVSLDELNALFLKDGVSARRAYVLAHAFTKDILEHTHHDLPKQLLALVKQGIPFHKAFAQTAFMTLNRAEETFWSQQTLWNRWIPVATSSAMLWLAITMLVFLAFTRQRKRTAAIKKRWEEDELDF